jgi:anti-sigma factor RsiW
MSDPLLRPTLQDREGDNALRERPWRLHSQFWVAFFGGALAVSVIASLNSRRLGVAGDSRRWIPVIAVLGLGSAALLAVLLVTSGIGSGARLANQVGGVVAYLPLQKIQKSADRVYHFYSDSPEDAYDSLWGPGLAAVFLLGLPVTVALAGIAATA